MGRLIPASFSGVFAPRSPPVWLIMAAMAPFAPAVGVKGGLKLALADPFGQGPTQSAHLKTLQGLPNRRGRKPQPPSNLTRRDIG